MRVCAFIFIPCRTPACRVNGREAPTDGAEFLSLSADEPLTFEVTLPRLSERVIVRPQSLGIVPEMLSPTSCRFTLPGPVYCTAEPYGRREALHLFPDAEPYANADPFCRPALISGTVTMHPNTCRRVRRKAPRAGDEARYRGGDQGRISDPFGKRNNVKKTLRGQ